MGMGIVSDDDFNKELSKCISPSNKSNKVTETVTGKVIDINNPGRKSGDNNVPESLRKIIGEESQINGRASALEIAKQFGISPSSVSAYNNGAHSTATYETKEPVLQTHIDNSKQRVISKARAKLVQSLNRITPQKLNDAKVRDLSGIAKDMSVIIKNMEPPVEENKNERNPLPAFILYAPTFIKEETFDVIHVKE
jgi:hypothetical protein